MTFFIDESNLPVEDANTFVFDCLWRSTTMGPGAKAEVTRKSGA